MVASSFRPYGKLVHQSWWAWQPSNQPKEKARAPLGFNRRRRRRRIFPLQSAHAPILCFMSYRLPRPQKGLSSVIAPGVVFVIFLLAKLCHFVQNLAGCPRSVCLFVYFGGKLAHPQRGGKIPVILN